MLARPLASETVSARAVCRLKCSVVANETAGPKRGPRPSANRVADTPSPRNSPGPAGASEVLKAPTSRLHVDEPCPRRRTASRWPPKLAWLPEPSGATGYGEQVGDRHDRPGDRHERCDGDEGARA